MSRDIYKNRPQNPYPGREENDRDDAPNRAREAARRAADEQDGKTDLRSEIEVARAAFINRGGLIRKLPPSGRGK